MPLQTALLERLTPRPLIIGLSTILGLTILASLFWPMGRDQGIFAWAGSVIVAGGLPYSDAWEVKGPLTHFVYAASQLLFGRNEWGIRVVDAAWLLLAIAAIRHIHVVLGYRGCTWLAVFLLAFPYYRTGWWHTAQPDGWAAILVVLMLAIVFRDQGRHRLSAAVSAGIVVALATLFKPLYALMLLPVGVHALSGEPRPIKRRLAYCLMCGVGFAAAIAACVAVFAAQGALATMFDVQVTFNAQFRAENYQWGIVSDLKGLIRSLSFYDVGQYLVAVVGLVVITQERRSAAAILATTILVAFVCIIAQGKFYRYHGVMPLGVVAVPAAVGLDALWRNVVSRSDGSLADAVRRPLAILVITISVLILVRSVSTPLWEIGSVSLRMLGIRSWESYQLRFVEGGRYFSYDESRRVADWLEANANEGDTLQVYAPDPLFNYLSGLPAINRFGFNYPLNVGPPHIRSRYRAEYLDAMRTNSPAFFIVGEDDRGNLMPNASRYYLERWSELSEWLEKNYRLAVKIDDFSIYRRRKPTDT